MFSILLDEQIDGLESNPPGLSVPNSPGPDEQSQEDVVTLTCIICSKQFEITQDLPGFSTVCSSCMFNSEESQRQSLIMKSLECCFDGCALDQFGPCEFCKSGFCEEHIGQHECAYSQESVIDEATTPQNPIPENPSTDVQEFLESQALTDIPENPSTDVQEFLESQALLHSFLNSLAYETPGNLNVN